MKMVIAVMSPEDASVTASELSKAGYISTTTSGIGGFLKSEKSVLMIGVENMRVSEVIEYIEKYSHVREQEVDSAQDGGFYTLPNKVKVGGAAVFVLDVDQFYKL